MAFFGTFLAHFRTRHTRHTKTNLSVSRKGGGTSSPRFVLRGRSSKEGSQGLSGACYIYPTMSSVDKKTRMADTVKKTLHTL